MYVFLWKIYILFFLFKTRPNCCIISYLFCWKDKKTSIWLVCSRFCRVEIYKLIPIIIRTKLYVYERFFLGGPDFPSKKRKKKSWNDLVEYGWAFRVTSLFTLCSFISEVLLTRCRAQECKFLLLGSSVLSPSNSCVHIICCLFYSSSS